MKNRQEVLSKIGKLEARIQAVTMELSNLNDEMQELYAELDDCNGDFNAPVNDIAEYIRNQRKM